MEEHIPAFPTPIYREGLNKLGYEGMTLRDYFAGQVLIGRTTRAYYLLDAKGFEELLDKQCYAVADAMLAEREKHGRA